jgi:flagellin
MQASKAMEVLDQRQQDLSVQIGKIGAIQSRLTTAANVLSSKRENSAAAYSRIVDADIAMETANLVTAQIKQQSAAQALKLNNNTAQTILQLLQ